MSTNDQPQLHEVNIGDELTEFAIAEPATAWWIPAGEWNRYEYLYNRTPLSEVAQAHTPITIRTERACTSRFHEAALVDYSAMWLRRVDGHAAEGRAVALVAGREGRARRAVRHAVAHAADRRQRRRRCTWRPT